MPGPMGVANAAVRQHARPRAKDCVIEYIALCLKGNGELCEN